MALSLADELLEFGYWKVRKTALIKRALNANFPVERIAAMMAISPQTVRDVKRSMSVKSGTRTVTPVENIVESL